MKLPLSSFGNGSSFNTRRRIKSSEIGVSERHRRKLSSESLGITSQRIANNDIITYNRLSIIDKALIEKCQNILNQSKVYVFEKYE